MTKTAVRRYISVFTKDDDSHVGDQEFLVEPMLNNLQKIFSANVNDLMYDEYKIGSFQANLLKPFVVDGFDFDFNRYEYFLSCDGAL